MKTGIKAGSVGEGRYKYSFCKTLVNLKVDCLEENSHHGAWHTIGVK